MEPATAAKLVKNGGSYRLVDPNNAEKNISQTLSL
jgi:hypothetical protein